jgi:hypothetical protein
MTESFARAPRAALIACVVLLVGCSGASSPTPADVSANNGLPPGGHDTSLVVRRGGLVQTLRVSSLSVKIGDTLSAQSILVNGSTGSVAVWRGYPCRLDVTETALQGRTGCLPPTGSVLLQPGDSVVGAERWVVRSAPGDYAFTVRQTVDTSLVVSARITVSSR